MQTFYQPHDKQTNCIVQYLQTRCKGSILWAPIWKQPERRGAVQCNQLHYRPSAAQRPFWRNMSFFSPLSLFSKILLSNDFFLTFGIHKPFGTHFTMLTFSSVCSGAQALWISWSDTAGFHRTSTPSIPQHCVNKGTRMMTSKYRIKQNKEQLNEGNQQKTIKYLNFAIETPNTSFYQQTSKYLGFVLRYGLYKIKVLFMVVKIK